MYTHFPIFFYFSGKKKNPTQNFRKFYICRSSCEDCSPVQYCYFPLFFSSCMMNLPSGSLYIYWNIFYLLRIKFACLWEYASESASWFLQRATKASRILISKALQEIIFHIKLYSLAVTVIETGSSILFRLR